MFKLDGRWQDVARKIWFSSPVSCCLFESHHHSLLAGFLEVPLSEPSALPGPVCFPLKESDSQSRRSAPTESVLSPLSKASLDWDGYQGAEQSGDYSSLIKPERRPHPPPLSSVSLKQRNLRLTGCLGFGTGTHQKSLERGGGQRQATRGPDGRDGHDLNWFADWVLEPRRTFPKSTSAEQLAHEKIICHFPFYNSSASKAPVILLQIIDLGNGGSSDCLHFTKGKGGDLSPNFQSLFWFRQKPFRSLFVKSAQK